MKDTFVFSPSEFLFFKVCYLLPKTPGIRKLIIEWRQHLTTIGIQQICPFVLTLRQLQTPYNAISASTQSKPNYVHNFLHLSNDYCPPKITDISKRNILNLHSEITVSWLECKRSLVYLKVPRSDHRHFRLKPWVSGVTESNECNDPDFELGREVNRANNEIELHEQIELSSIECKIVEWFNDEMHIKCNNPITQHSHSFSI